MASVFGTVIHEWRTGRGLSLQETGELLGVARQTVWHWEQGRSHPSMPDVPRIAGVLGVTICELYGVDEGHARPGSNRSIADRFVSTVLPTLTLADEEFLAEMAAGLERYRQRLRAQEGLQQES